MKIKRTKHPGKNGFKVLLIVAIAATLLTIVAGAAGFGALTVLTDHGNCDEPSGGVFQCRLGSLAPGESATVHVRLIPSSPGTLTNTASAFGSEPDPNTSNNTASVMTTVVGQPAPTDDADVAVKKRTLQSRISVGTEFVYEVVVTNHGPVTATNVELNDSLPLTVNFVSASGAACAGAPGLSVVRCTIAELPAGASAVVRIKVVPTSIGPIMNLVTVSADQPDPNPENNEDMITTHVVQRSVDLHVTKSGSPSIAEVGNELIYTVTVTNNGPDAANSIVLDDAITSGD